MSETSEIKQLPANVTTAINIREQALKKIEKLKKEKAKYDAAIKLLEGKVKENDSLLLQLHKEHGDFQIGELTVTTHTSWKTVVHNEDKLPASCFKVKKEVSLTAVKELIMEGKISRDVATQEKSESIKIK